MLLCAAVLNYSYLHKLLWKNVCHSGATLQNTQIIRHKVEALRKVLKNKI